MSNLVEHAERELRLAGFYDDNIGEAMAKDIVEVVSVFAKQGHSGFSAATVISALGRILNFDNLAPLTNDPEEWEEVTHMMGGKETWQNIRNPRVFSNDGGQTWRVLD